MLLVACFPSYSDRFSSSLPKEPSWSPAEDIRRFSPKMMLKHGRSQAPRPDSQIRDHHTEDSGGNNESGGGGGDGGDGDGDEKVAREYGGDHQVLESARDSSSPIREVHPSSPVHAARASPDHAPDFGAIELKDYFESTCSQVGAHAHVL